MMDSERFASTGRPRLADASESWERFESMDDVFPNREVAAKWSFFLGERGEKICTLASEIVSQSEGESHHAVHGTANRNRQPARQSSGCPHSGKPGQHRDGFGCGNDFLTTAPRR